MSWKTLVPHANTKASGLECRMAISDAGRVTLRASAQVFAEAGIAMGDRVVVALGEGEDAGWLRLSKSDRGWKVGSNASGPEQGATYKITFTPQRGLFPEARKSYEVRWQIFEAGFLDICWGPKIAASVAVIRKTTQPSIAPAEDVFAEPRSMEQIEQPIVPPPDIFSMGSFGGRKPRKEVVPVGTAKPLGAQPPSPEPAAGADPTSTTFTTECPKCGSPNMESNYGGERGEAGPFLRCLTCAWDEEEEDAQVEVLAELTMAVAGVAVDQERAEQAPPPQPNPKIPPIRQPRNPPPPWGAGVLDGASPVAKHSDEYLPLTTPETWKALRQIMHDVKAAGATMTRVNVPMPGRDRMKLNGEEMTPEECLEKAREIVAKWEAAA